MRKRKSKRSRLIRECDALFARLIRLKRGGRCEYCGKIPKPRGLHLHHIFSRRCLRTRWDERNVVLLCFHCHRFVAHSSVAGFREWAEVRLGPTEWALLTLEYQKGKPVKIHQLELQRRILEFQIQEVDSGGHK